MIAYVCISPTNTYNSVMEIPILFFSRVVKLILVFDLNFIGRARANVNLKKFVRVQYLAVGVETRAEREEETAWQWLENNYSQEGAFSPCTES